MLGLGGIGMSWIFEFNLDGEGEDCLGVWVVVLFFKGVWVLFFGLFWGVRFGYL